MKDATSVAYAPTGLGPDPTFEEVHRALSVPPDAAGFGRRSFLLGALATGGVASLGLGAFGGVAAASEPLGPADTILVLIQLGGGNDGLATVIPVDDPAYTQLRRPSVRVSRTHPLGDGLAFNGALSSIALGYAYGKVAVVEGVGLPEGDRNHFTSMATWMAGTTSTDRTTGWLGRFLDGLPDGDSGLRGVTLDGRVPLHLAGTRSEVSAIGGPAPFGAERTWGSRMALYDGLASYGPSTGRGPVADRIAALNHTSIERARRLGAHDVGGDALTRQLKTAARLINLNLGIRVLCVTHGSFDTHEGQLTTHQHLLESFNAGIEAFYAQLAPEWSDQVVLATFSEFGRRAQDNGSGTDHGSAAAHLVIGERVRGGLYGVRPSLTDLTPGGDLRVTTDYRSYYASLLGGWLGAEPASVLGGSFAELPIIASLPTAPAGPVALPADSRFAPFHDAGIFVDQQYSDFLDSRPTAANRSAWVQRLRSGSTSIWSALEEFFEASAYASRGVLANRLAWSLTGGPASGDDLRRWLAEGTTLRPLAEEIVASAPWRRRYSRLVWGDLVNRLHQDLTGRLPSALYLSTWRPKLGAKPESGSVDMIVDLALTPAAKARHLEEAEVSALHTAMLRREPLAAFAVHWANQRRAGLPMAWFGAVFFQAEPYRARFV